MRVKTRRQIRLKFPENVIADDKPETWAEFCDATTIHGLRYIFGTNRSNIMRRVMWAGIFGTMALLCIWFCTSTVQHYLTSNVVTARTFQKAEVLEFPAVTFCNQNMFLKSRVGRSWNHMKTLATFSLISNNPEDIENQAMEEWKYCNSTNELSPPDFEDTDEFWQENGYVQGMRELTSDFYSSVIGVEHDVTNFDLFKSKLKSEDMFVNHIADDDMCFTYNPGKQLIASVTNASGHLDEHFGYGLSADFLRSPKLVVTSGVLNGLMVELRSSRDQFCGVRQKWQGVGFKAIVHHPEEQPWFLMQKPISIGPSHTVFVAISVTKLTRKTSNLGRCVEHVDLHLFPNLSMYFKGHCYQQCFAEQVFKKCGCFPQFMYRNQARDKHHVYIGGKKVKIRITCWNDTLICMNRMKKKFLKSNLQQRCPMCEEPCNETLYNTEVSSLLFPTEHTSTIFAQRNSIPEETYRNEYMNAIFYFPQMVVMDVSERPEFTILDVFSYFGGILGLFLGASLMSIGEVVQQAIVSGIHHKRSKHQEKRKKKRGEKLK